MFIVAEMVLGGAVLGGIIAGLCLFAGTCHAAETENPARGGRLFPTDLPRRDWVHFNAQGFSEPVCGVVYRLSDPVTNGMALGGIDVGCMDLETSGLLGYSTIFNSHVPRRGPINLPVLGMSIGADTWVLCDPTQTKQGSGQHQTKAPGNKPFPPVWDDLRLDGVRTASQIHYWGHYPVVDVEFETDAPVSAGLRAWAPFLPGDVLQSIIPAIVLEVHLRNVSGSPQQGAVAFSFPGPTPEEADTDFFVRTSLTGDVSGVAVAGKLASYALGVIGNQHARSGGELGADGASWASISEALPPGGSQPGSSVAVDFSLEPGEGAVVRFLLTWSAPTWNNVGVNHATDISQGYSGEVRTFTHMYSKHYPEAEKTAQLMAERHEKLLQRVLAWQQVVYTDNKLPVWLRDSLINSLYMLAEDGMWAQAQAPLPDWVSEEDGLFGLNECPRGCPQIECIPCSFYGSLPLVYFFPELQLSTIRGYQGYQYDDGAPPWIFGGCTGKTSYIDFAAPTRGYQFASNGISLAGIVDRFLLCHDTQDKAYTKEFYPMIKRCMEWTMNLRTTPGFSAGQRAISMPDPDSDESLIPPTEWFEAREPGWQGMTAHIGGLHLAQLRITERLAREVGDEGFARQCAEWLEAGAAAMEEDLWTGSYYLNYYDPSTGAKSEFVFGYQLDGEWITAHHALPSALPQERVCTTLDTITRCNVALTKYGAVNYANPDGTAIPPAKEGVWDYGRFSYFPPKRRCLQ